MTEFFLEDAIEAEKRARGEISEEVLDTFVEVCQGLSLNALTLTLTLTSNPTPNP